MLKYIVVVIISVLAVMLMPNFSTISKESDIVENNKRNEFVPKYWLFNRDEQKYFIFESVEKILNKLGLEKIVMNTSSMETIHNDWDLLWTYNYMEYIPINFTALNHYQKINHLPGNFRLISKSVFSSTTDSKYVPKGFLNAEALNAYAEKNPNTRFVQKKKSNRGVSLKTVPEIDFSKTESFQTDKFAQVFVEDPLLIAGHKFDFNVFVAITSIDPLRVYYYAKDFHMRFCKLPYDPGNFSDPDTYVIGDSHIPGADFPEIKKYFDKSFKFKDAFEMYLIEHGHDPQIIYDQIEHSINSIVMSKEKFLIETSNNFKAPYGKFHYFELVRFDFLIDAKLNLHIMEINMSPNLHAQGHIVNNRNLFESVIYNTFNLVGVGTYLKKNHIRQFMSDEEPFLCPDSSVSVRPDICVKSPCDMSCESPQCAICWHCLEPTMKTDMKFSYMEHMNIGDMQRVVPPSNVSI